MSQAGPLVTWFPQSRIQTFDPSLPLSGLDKKTPDISDVHTLPLHITGPAEAAKQQ